LENPSGSKKPPARHFQASDPLFPGIAKNLSVLWETHKELLQARISRLLCLSNKDPMLFGSKRAASLPRSGRPETIGESSGISGGPTMLPNEARAIRVGYLFPPFKYPKIPSGLKRTACSSHPSSNEARAIRVGYLFPPFMHPKMQSGWKWTAYASHPSLDETQSIRAGYLSPPFMHPKMQSGWKRTACTSHPSLEEGRDESVGLSTRPVESSEEALTGRIKQTNRSIQPPMKTFRSKSQSARSLQRFPNALPTNADNSLVPSENPKISFRYK
jgi:hypothetical protein